MPGTPFDFMQIEQSLVDSTYKDGTDVVYEYNYEVDGVSCSAFFHSWASLLNYAEADIEESGASPISVSLNGETLDTNVLNELSLRKRPRRRKPFKKMRAKPRIV